MPKTRPDRFDWKFSSLQRKVAKFFRNDVLLNFDLLEKYLMSEESIFSIKTLHDFLHCMSLLGFHRFPLPEKTERRFLCYRFVNPNFIEFGAIPDDLYKIPFNPIFSSLKHKKQVLSTYTVQFLRRLVSIVSKQKMTNLEWAQMKLQFSLQKELETIRDQTIEIEFVFDEPDYSKNNEIAGYYGNVSLDLLCEAFEDYFPIYLKEEVPLAMTDTLDVDEKPPTTLMEWSDETIKTEPPSTPVIVYESAMNDVAENVDVTTARKKRRTLKPQAHVSSKETEDALKFLHKDSIKMESEQWFD